MIFVLHYVFWMLLYTLKCTVSELLTVGNLHSTFEGYCSGKNEWLEKTSCLSAREKDGDFFPLIAINNILTCGTGNNSIVYQVEMTGDYTPDLMAILSADIIISTPEKWDGISRNWHSRAYVKKVHPFIHILLLFSSSRRH